MVTILGELMSQVLVYLAHLVISALRELQAILVNYYIALKGITALREHRPLFRILAQMARTVQW